MSSLHVAYKMFILVSACIISFILISFFYRTEDNDLHTEVNANYTYVHIKTITLCIISRTYQIQVSLRQIYVLELSLLYNPTTFWEKKSSGLIYSSGLNNGSVYVSVIDLSQINHKYNRYKHFVLSDN